MSADPVPSRAAGPDATTEPDRLSAPDPPMEQHVAPEPGVHLPQLGLEPGVVSVPEGLLVAGPAVPDLMASGTDVLMDGAEASLVQAAGAVCWRLRDGELEVLVVHRPRYDDWSWPKGKLEPGETEPTAAVREVAEETGLTVVLGRPLPTARYRLSDFSTKTVRYWAAHVPDDLAQPPPRPQEVDRCEWVSVGEADRRLTRRADRAQLQALSTAHAGSELHTWPFLVLRHGHARPKSAWGREDAERPLVEAGRQQAQFLATLLTAWSPRKVFSSPWKRCVQSIEPYAEANGAKVRTKGRLSEDGHRRDRGKTASLVAKQLRKGQPVMVCTHRPVLGTVLGVLAGHAAVGRSRDLPQQDPFLDPGEVLVAHVSQRSGRVVAVERHTSPTG